MKKLILYCTLVLMILSSLSLKAMEHNENKRHERTHSARVCLIGFTLLTASALLYQSYHPNQTTISHTAPLEECSFMNVHSDAGTSPRIITIQGTKECNQWRTLPHYVEIPSFDNECVDTSLENQE